MSSLRSTGLPNADHYSIGRGVPTLADVNAAGFPLAFRDLGNAPSFSLTVESENQEHVSSRTGVRTVDKDVAIQTSATAALTLDEMNFDNWAMFLQGTVAETTQAGGAVTGTENVVLSTPDAALPQLALGRWYDLYARANMSTGVAYLGDSADVRVYSITGVVVTLSSGGSALTVNVDYEVDLDHGRLFIYDNAANRTRWISGGALIEEELDVDFTKTAGTIEEVQGLTQTTFTGCLKFVGVNAANPATKLEVQIHAITLKPDGENSLIGDEFAEMAFTGKCEARPTVDPDSPVVRIRSFRA